MTKVLSYAWHAAEIKVSISDVLYATSCRTPSNSEYTEVHCLSDKSSEKKNKQKNTEHLIIVPCSA